MIIAITGTPGTGKSAVSKGLRGDGYQVLSLNEIASAEKLILRYDKTRHTYEVDLQGLNKHLRKILFRNNKEKSTDQQFLEGHIAHLLDIPETVIILRCHPEELERRLRAKGWSEQKVRENLEAEAVDVITVECTNKYAQDKIFEIDTTNLQPIEIKEIILKIINGKAKGYEPGQIDWSEEILKWY